MKDWFRVYSKQLLIVSIFFIGIKVSSIPNKWSLVSILIYAIGFHLFDKFFKEKIRESH